VSLREFARIMPKLAAVLRIECPHVVGRGDVEHAVDSENGALIVPPVNSRVPTPPIIVGGTPPRAPVTTRVVHARVRRFTLSVVICVRAL
jgi:hypothetical protein